MKILVVEDNVDLLRSVVRFLTKEGYSVDESTDGDEGLDLALTNRYDCIVLDVMLPGVDGFEFVQTLRDSEIQTPVLMLTALDAVDDKIKGISSGADDYMTKPFDFRELLVRIKSLIRRSNLTKGEEIVFKDLKLNSKTRQVIINGQLVKLSKREFDLLELFLRNPEVIFSRDELIERVWENEKEIKSNVVDVYVLYLRNKLKSYGYEKYIETVSGLGYRFRKG
ncbi:MAG: response regulator transcription factor [Pseudothermotoga sp.]